MRSRSGIAFVASCLLLAALGRGTVLGQAGGTAPAEATKPAFEVASVKSASMDNLGAQFQAGRMPRIGADVGHGRAEYSLMSLRQLIAVAYGIKPFQISGPDWLNSEHFVITAKMPEGAADADAPAMLQTLLEERFKLAAHRSREERPVMALVVAKGGAKLMQATLPALPIEPDAPLKPGQMKINMGEGPAIVTPGAGASVVINMGEKGTFTQTMDGQTQTLHMKGENLTMDGFADMLTRMSQIGPPGATSSAKQVMNMTGVPGHYQVAVDLSLAELMALARAQGMGVPPAAVPGAGEASDPAGGGATLQAAVKAMGLKLEPRRAPVEQLVIDHMEKTPTDD